MIGLVFGIINGIGVGGGGMLVGFMVGYFYWIIGSYM